MPNSVVAQPASQFWCTQTMAAGAGVDSQEARGVGRAQVGGALGSVGGVTPVLARSCQYASSRSACQYVSRRSFDCAGEPDYSPKAALLQ